MDAEHGNFQIQPGSPAENIGFQPIDFSQAGVYEDAGWKQLAATTVYPEAYVVPAPEPMVLRDDFEHGPQSSFFQPATLDQEGRADLIAITDLTAVSGQHSLRIQDRTDLKAGYNPHFYWDPQYTKGRAHLAYAIQLEPDATVNCEWRSQGSPYRTGPSLQFRQGAVFSRDRKLLDLPDKAWIRVEMRAMLGQTNSHWDLVLKLPTGEVRDFNRLPCDPEWKVARWVGFSSVAATTAGLFLDDVEMENR